MSISVSQFIRPLLYPLMTIGCFLHLVCSLDPLLYFGSSDVAFFFFFWQGAGLIDVWPVMYWQVEEKLPFNS